MAANNFGEPKASEFYDFWTQCTSGQLSEPSVMCTEFLRKLHPGAAIISFSDAPGFKVQSLPGVKTVSLDTRSISIKGFAATARKLLREGRAPGEIVDHWKFAVLKLEWEDEEFLCYVVAFTARTLHGAQATLHFLVHSDAIRCQALLEASGAWQAQLHEEILFFDNGHWQKSHELWVEVQKAKWEEVILKEEFKEQAMGDVEGFFRSEALYKSLSVPWKRGIIFHGPPGNGKTITIKAVMRVCAEQGFAPLYVKSFRHHGGDEASMGEVFAKAREMAPCIMVLEDLDALITDKNRSFFLNQLDGLEGNDGLLLIASTNHLDKLDIGLSGRPSRFDRKFAFDDPDERERALYMKYWQAKLNDSSTVQFPDSLSDELVTETAGFSFAYLKEMLISSLVLLANPKHTTTSFGDIAKDQIKDLRAQMEKAKSQAAVHLPNQSQGTSSASSAAVQGAWVSMVAMPLQPDFIG